jgi:hypothetical protein
MPTALYVGWITCQLLEMIGKYETVVIVVVVGFGCLVAHWVLTELWPA